MSICSMPSAKGHIKNQLKYTKKIINFIHRFKQIRKERKISNMCDRRRGSWTHFYPIPMVWKREQY